MRAGGLIIAAPASGSGKTLVTAGLLRALRRRGRRVSAAKVGPDFIDPSFHTRASGRPCHNLDVWAMREAHLAAIVARLEADAEIVLCEGVMGLFDGTGGVGEAGSTADLASLLGWPVVLVVDARGQGASVAALLGGIVAHRPWVTVAGVVFNRVRGARHEKLLAGATVRYLPQLSILGACPEDSALTLTSRHLGLVPAPENGEADRIIDDAATAVEAGLEIDRLIQLARPARLIGDYRTTYIPPLGGHIAVAHDAAFSFIYPMLVDDWERDGANIAWFSPLAGEPPDPAADAVFLPGGYPELWAGRLAAAHSFLSGLRRAAAAGKPVYGECGGFMVLGEALYDATGVRHQMAGLLPLVSSFAERRPVCGYREITLVADGPLGKAGTAFRGHEFHHATVTHEGDAERLWRTSDAAGTGLGAVGLRRGSVSGSFIHLLARSNSPD